MTDSLGSSHTVRPVLLKMLAEFLLEYGARAAVDVDDLGDAVTVRVGERLAVTAMAATPRGVDSPKAANRDR